MSPLYVFRCIFYLTQFRCFYNYVIRSLQSVCVLFIITIDYLNSNMSFTVDFHTSAASNFFPVNPYEMLGIDSSVQAEADCTFLCDWDPRCWTFVFGTPTCRLHERSISTEQIVSASSSRAVLLVVDYKHINLVSAYN